MNERTDERAAPIDALVDALSEVVGKIARASLLVVGDAILDRYVYGEVERISPEAPVPLLTIRREIVVPGGAGNVVRNLGSLGASVAFVSVVGDDQAGSELTGLIGGQAQVEPWLLVQGGLTTPLKTRFVAGGQQVLRTDREDRVLLGDSPIHPRLAERLERIARDAMAATSITVLSDYRKGVLTTTLGPALIAAARTTGRSVVVGMRGVGFARYAGAAVVVTAWRDLAMATGVAGEDDGTVATAAAALRRAQDFGAVVVVRSGFGLSLVDAGGAAHHPPLVPEILDLAGVGDSIVAVVGGALAAGATIAQAVALASHAGGVVAGRTGTAVIRPADLLHALATPHLQRVVTHAVAAERLERWRRAGWRVGLWHLPRGGVVDAETLRRARGASDRLAIVVRHGDDAAVAAAAGADLVLVEPELEVAMHLLRPDWMA